MGHPNYSVTIAIPSILVTRTIPTGGVFFLVYTPVLTPAGSAGGTPSGEEPLGLYFNLEAYLTDVLLGEILFANPVALTVEYDETALNGLPEEQIQLLGWDDETGQWSNAGIAILQRDTDKNIMTAAATHTAEFGLFTMGAPNNTPIITYLPLVANSQQERNKWTSGLFLPITTR